MATSLELLIKARDETNAAFKSVIGNLNATDAQAKKTSTSLDSVSVRAGKLSDAIGKTSTTLARSASAFGLSAGAMRNIGDVADVAQLGFDNLSKSAAGFNAASFAVVGAGFAIGTALGKMAMEFDIVRENAFAAGEAIHNAFSSQQTQSINEMAAATSNWAIEQKKVAAANEALLRKVTTGLSAEEIQKLLFPEPPKGIRERILDEAKAFEEAQKKKEASAKRAAEAASAAAKQAAAEQRRADEEVNRLREHTAQEWDKFYATLAKEESNLTDWVQQEAQARTDAIVQGLLDEMLAAREAAEDRKQSYEDMSGAMLDAIERRRNAELDAQEDFANLLGKVADLFQDFGLSADNAFVSVLRGFESGLHAATAFADATNNAQKAMAGLAALQGAFNAGSAKGGAAAGATFGAQFGLLGAGIGAAVGALAGLFGGAKKAREEMNKLRDEFVKSAGGMAALKAQAAAAGVSLDGMFKQKNAEALSRQIDTIKAKLQDWDEAQKILTEGMQKYGIAVEDMGAKFASLELDKQAREMAMFFAAAIQVGANASAVTAGMKDEVLALVAQYQAAGLAIPAALKPILEAMLKNGDLVKENGEAYGSLEEAGITFAQTMEGALANIAEEINKLMRVLAQGFHIPITYDVQGDAGAPSGGGAGHPPREDVPEFAQGGHTGDGSGAFMARLHRGETVVPDEKMAGFLAAAMAQAAPMMGGGNITVHVPLSVGNREWGQANANVSRRRQGRTSPNSVRRF